MTVREARNDEAFQCCFEHTTLTAMSILAGGVDKWGLKGEYIERALSAMEGRRGREGALR